MKKVKCPYCKKLTKLVSSTVVYDGRDFGMVYLCKCEPDLVYVGCHKDTTEPLGTPANKELRSLRKDLHIIFDIRWEGRAGSRNKAYRWLCKKMDMKRNQCHIGKFNESQCKKAINVCLNNLI